MKQRKTPWQISVGLVLIALAIGLCVCELNDWLVSLKDPIDLYDVDYDDLKANQHVEMDIELVWDELYSETTTNTVNGVAIRSSAHESGRGYVIPLLAEEDDYITVDKLLLIKAEREADYDTLDEILEETNDWWLDETGTVDYGKTKFAVDGVLAKMSKDEKELMEEYLEDYMGLSSSEVDDYLLPYTIKQINPAKGKIFILVAAVSVVVGIALFVWGCSLSKKMAKEEQEQLAAYNTQYNYSVDPYTQQNNYSADSYTQQNNYSADSYTQQNNNGQ